jgi:dGTP triphosphohydrolase
MLQMSAMKACFQIAECSKSSAKIMENNGKTMENTQKVPIVVPKVAFLSTFGTTIELFCILKVDAAVNPSRFYSKQLLRRVSSQYDIENESLEERIMAVLDYISGMTDIYALDIYQKINGISLPIV